MPLVRQRIYFEPTLSRKSHVEAWFGYSIFLATGILAISLLIWIPDVTSTLVSNFLPYRLAHRLSTVEDAENLVSSICEGFAIISTFYLVIALFVRRKTRRSSMPPG